MIPITELHNVRALTNNPRGLCVDISKKQHRRRRKFARTRAATDEDILSSRLGNTRVRLNVGGEVHEVMWRTLKRMPFTRLGLLRKALSHDQIMELCDDYDLTKNEYYFDRHPKSFLCVLTMFRTGNLHMIEDLCIVNFADDLEYWGINENLMESCCHHRYHMKRERINEEMKKIKDINEETSTIEQFGDGRFNQFRKRLWDLMENPQTSIGAQVIAVISVLFILISISCLTISTLPQFQSNDSSDEDTKVSNQSETNATKAEQTVASYLEDHALEIVEVVCIIWFTFEYVSRLFASPDKKAFLKSPMNMIDILAIMPYFISVAFTKIFSNQNMESLISVRKAVQVFRILRVLRILKLARHSTGLQALGYTLQKSYKELGMLVMFIALGVLLFSSLIYFAEREVKDNVFSSIPATFWWAIITMTTVGYGDMTPKSELGKFIGSFCCICGVLVIALPIPIIVNNFADYYKDQLRREKTLKRKEDMARARQLGSIISSRTDEGDSVGDDDDDDDELDHITKNSSGGRLGGSGGDFSYDLERGRHKRSHSLKPVCENDLNQDNPRSGSSSLLNRSRVMIHNHRRSRTASAADLCHHSNRYHPDRLRNPSCRAEIVAAHFRSQPPLTDTKAYKIQQMHMHKLLRRRYTRQEEYRIDGPLHAPDLVTVATDDPSNDGGEQHSPIPSDTADERDTLIGPPPLLRRSMTVVPNEEALHVGSNGSSAGQSNYLKRFMNNLMPKSQSSNYLRCGGPTTSL